MSNSAVLTAPAPRLLAGQYDFVVKAPAPHINAAGASTPTLQAALLAPTPTLASAGLTGVIGTVVVQLPVATLLGIGTVPVVGNTAVVIRRPILSIGGVTGTIGSVIVKAPAPLIVAAGYPPYSGSAQRVLPAGRLSSLVVVPVTVAFRNWVLNTRKGALTEYGPEFAFNSFTIFNGQVLACGASGIVVLGTQGKDNTTAIDARVRTGADSLNMSYLKRVPRLYTSYSSDGDMLFRTITTEGGTRTYALPFNGISAIQQRRVPVGKGPKSRFWTYEWENVNGSDFSINDLLVYPIPLRRRVQ